jgi:hypothetical protein
MVGPTVVNLQREKSDSLIESLRELLASAERGELVNILYVGEKFLGGERVYYTGSQGPVDDAPRRYGMLSLMLWEEQYYYFKSHRGDGP